jgi:hypothetical protein
MSNPYVEYYKDQAGSGITGFQGVRYQRGYGFFGRLLSKAIYPLLRFLGKQAFNTGVNIASDVYDNKKGWKESAKERFKETGRTIAKAGIDRAKHFQQTGKGRRRRRRTKKTNDFFSKFIKRGKQKKRKTKKRKSIKRKKTKRSSASALRKLMQNVNRYT